MFPAFSNTSFNNNISNLFSKFTYTSVYGTLLFFIFLITISVLFSTYKGGILSNKEQLGPVIIIVLLISILWGILLVSNLYSGSASNINSMNFDSFRNGILLLFSIIIACLLIVWTVYQIQQLSSNSGMGVYSFILNLFIILSVLGLIYKTFVVRLPIGNSKKMHFFNY